MVNVSVLVAPPGILCSSVAPASLRLRDFVRSVTVTRPPAAWRCGEFAIRTANVNVAPTWMLAGGFPTCLSGGRPGFWGAAAGGGGSPRAPPPRGGSPHG